MPKHPNILKSFSLSLLLLGFMSVSCVSTDKIEIKSEKDIFFSHFSNFEQSSSNFRVGAEIDSLIYHFKIKAMTTAYFDDAKYTPNTIYILKHQSGDSLVIKTNDAPLISHEEFKTFYDFNKSNLSSDTILDSSVFDKFFLIDHEEIVNVESFENLPFLFLDVNFNGYPALLVRKDVGQHFYYYDIYGINSDGFSKVNFEPYVSIKSRVNPWCYGGSTEFDYKNKTIKVFGLANESCSDYGTEIIDIYKLNETSQKFVKSQITRKYDFN